MIPYPDLIKERLHTFFKQSDEISFTVGRLRSSNGDLSVLENWWITIENKCLGISVRRVLWIKPSLTSLIIPIVLIGRQIMPFINSDVPSDHDHEEKLKGLTIIDPSASNDWRHFISHCSIMNSTKKGTWIIDLLFIPGSAGADVCWRRVCTNTAHIGWDLSERKRLILSWGRRGGCNATTTWWLMMAICRRSGMRSFGQAQRAEDLVWWKWIVCEIPECGFMSHTWMTDTQTMFTVHTCYTHFHP